MTLCGWGLRVERLLASACWCERGSCSFSDDWHLLKDWGRLVIWNIHMICSGGSRIDERGFQWRCYDILARGAHN